MSRFIYSRHKLWNEEFVWNKKNVFKLTESVLRSFQVQEVDSCLINCLQISFGVFQKTIMWTIEKGKLNSGSRLKLFFFFFLLKIELMHFRQIACPLPYHCNTVSSILSQRCFVLFSITSSIKRKLSTNSAAESTVA